MIAAPAKRTRPPQIDRTGHRYGRLVVVEKAPHTDGRARWVCACDCGGKTVVLGFTLGNGRTSSCGCYFMEVRRRKGVNTTHGMSDTRTYRIWMGILRRCRNKRDHAYPRYGGRGIKICPQWLTFDCFLADMGHAPEGEEIERIDVDGNYEPSNCRWATIKEQANNKRNNRMVFHDGEWLTLAQYAEAASLKYCTAYYRKVVVGDSEPREVIVRRMTAERSLLMEDAE